MDDKAFLDDMAGVLEVLPSELSEDFALHDGNFDSLAIVGTLGLIDEHYGITVSGDALRKCASIRELLQLIRGKTA